MAIRSLTPNPVYMLVLSTLTEAPMHPYEIQRLAIEREKTSVHGVRRGSIYHAVQKLEAAGLIEALESHREGRRPERTVYQLTELGRDEAKQWLISMLRRPGTEVSQMVTALEFIPMIEPVEALAALEYRVFQLDRDIGGLRASLTSVGGRLPRVFIIEVEFTVAMKEAERAWTDAIADELRAGKFTWSRAELHQWAQQSPLSSGVHRPAEAD